MKKINLQSSFKVSMVLKSVCLVIVLVLLMDNTFAMHINLPFAEVAQSADIIFLGTVERQESLFNEQQTSILTEVLFTDTVIIHATGQAVQRDASFITLKYAGGCVGDVCLDVSIAPSFREGHRYLVFMSDDGRTYVNPIIGGAQGLFEVVEDVQTGAEYVLAAGRKSILGIKDQGFIKSKLPVSHIQDGVPVYDKSSDYDSERFFTQPPSPASPLDTSSISLPDAEQGSRETRALKLSDFINHIKDKALRVQLEKRILKRQGQGFFLKKRGTAIQQLPLEQRIPATTGWQVDPQEGESLQTESTASIVTDERVPARPLGGQLGYCGYHSLLFTLEMVPQDWWSYNTFESSRTTWNKFMEVYRKRASDGKVGHNSENEICGWLEDSTMYDIYGVHWNGYLGWAHSWWRSGSPCGRLLESDIIFNPTYSWTDDENFAIGNNDVILLRPVAMHELAHTWGMQRGKEGEWGYPETYDYDYPSVVHSYYHDIVENGRGIHFPEAYSIRRLYSNQTSIKKSFVDVGVESYYANNGLHNSTTDLSAYYPGDSISLNDITVENNSYNDVSDVRVRFYLSSDRNITTADYQIGSYWYWESFNKESRTVFDVNSAIPANVPAGTYYVGVIVTVKGFEQDDFTNNNNTSFFNSITIRVRGTDGDGEDDGGGKCFIATAAFNSASHPYVMILRNFRDRYLLHSQFGRQLVDLYYKYSPFLAQIISKHDILKTAVRTSLTPLVAICGAVLQ